MDTEKIGIKLFFLSLVFLLLTEAGSMFLASCYEGRGLLILGGARVLQLTAFLIAVLIYGRGLSDIGLAKQQILPGLRQGLKWSLWFGIAACIGLVGLYVGGFDVLKIMHTRLPDAGDDLLLFFLVGGILAPFAEEVFFRGILYGFFRRWGMWTALFMSTLFFVLAHQSVSLIQVTGGVVFAIAYEKEGALMVPVTIHALGNLSLFSLSMYAENMVVPILIMYF